MYSALISFIVEQPSGLLSQVPQHEVLSSVRHKPGALHTVKLDQGYTNPGRQIAVAITFLTAMTRILLAPTFFSKCTFKLYESKINRFYAEIDQRRSTRNNRLNIRACKNLGTVCIVQQFSSLDFILSELSRRLDEESF